MSGLRYHDDQDVHLGDECNIDGWRATIISVSRDSDGAIRGKTIEDLDGSEQAGSEFALWPSSWTLLRRADARPVIGKDRDGREVRVGDRVRHRLGGSITVFRCINGFFEEEPPPGGLVAGILCCESELCTAPATEPAPPPAEPTGRAVAIINEQAERRIPRTPESLAATARTRSKAEAASLNERYAAFRSTVERVVAEEAPMAKVVMDTTGRQSFILEVDFGHGFRREVCLAAGTCDTPSAGAERMIREWAKLASYTLGNRALRGELGARALGAKGGR